jgi:type II secretory pathway component PulF
MDQLEAKIDSLEEKIDKLQSAIDALKRVFLWILIVSVILFVLPLIGLVFIIPEFISTYSSVLQ